MHLLVDARLTEPAKVTVQPTSCPPKSMHTSFKIVIQSLSLKDSLYLLLLNETVSDGLIRHQRLLNFMQYEFPLYFGSLF